MATLRTPIPLHSWAALRFAPRLLGASIAFEAVFGVFVVAFVVLSVVTLRWAIRRDRVGRAEWLRRHPPEPDISADIPPPKMNGHTPGSKGHKGPSRGRRPRGG